MTYEGKTLTIKEFRELGYIQELNRRFLHPLGLALEVTINLEDGEEAIFRVWDARDDPEGFVYAPGMIDTARAEAIYSEEDQREEARKQALGFIIQPTNE